MKRHNYIKRGISAVLITSMVFALSACGKEQQKVSIEPMEIEEVHAVSFDFLGGKDVMPISGYHGPYTTEQSFDGVSLPNYFTDEIFEAISDCGINKMHHAYTNYQQAQESAIKMLELGEKYNVGIFVTGLFHLGFVLNIHSSCSVSWNFLPF